MAAARWWLGVGWATAGCAVGCCARAAELIIRKLGKLESLRKQSVPELVFAYFHNKYGQKVREGVRGGDCLLPARATPSVGKKARASKGEREGGCMVLLRRRQQDSALLEPWVRMFAPHQTHQLILRCCGPLGLQNVVNEYVGSLVNTLTVFKSADLRLEAFAKFLSEEWDFLTFMDFLTAQSMLIQVRASPWRLPGLLAM